MPEVMPCPATMSDAELLKLKHRFDDVCQSSTTPELFELCRAGSHLVDAIRALPPRPDEAGTTIYMHMHGYEWNTTEPQIKEAA